MRIRDKRIALTILLLAGTLSVFGQGKTDTAYTKFMAAGQAAYYEKNFDEAIRQFNAARLRKNNEEVANWLERVNKGYIHFLDSLSKENEKQARFAEAGRLSLLSGTELENHQYRKALILSQEALKIADTAATEEMKLAFGNAVGKVLIQELATFPEAIESLQRAGDHLLIQQVGGTLSLFAAETEQALTFKPHPAPLRYAALSPTGRHLVTCADDNTAKLWDTSGKLIAQLTGHSQAVTHGIFSPDEKLVATASRDDAVKIWSRTGELKTTLTGHSGNVYQTAFAPDNSRLVSRSSDGSSRSWIVGEWRAGAPVSGSYFQDVQFSGDSRYLLLLTTDGKVEIKDLETGEVLPRNTDRPDDVAGIRVFPGFFFSFSRNGTIRQWTGNGQLLRTWDGHPEEVVDLDLSPDQQLLLTTAKDNRCRLWDKSGALLLTIELESQEDLVPAFFSSDGKHIIGIQNNRLFKCPIPAVAWQYLQDHPLPAGEVAAVKKDFGVQRFDRKQK